MYYCMFFVFLLSFIVTHCDVPSVSFFFFSSRRRHTRCLSDWSSDVCSSDLVERGLQGIPLDSQRRLRALRKAGEIDLGQQRGADDLGLGVGLHDAADGGARSEERRVGKECRSGWSTCREEEGRGANGIRQQG